MINLYTIIHCKLTFFYSVYSAIPWLSPANLLSGAAKGYTKFPLILVFFYCLKVGLIIYCIAKYFFFYYLKLHFRVKQLLLVELSEQSEI